MIEWNGVKYYTLKEVAEILHYHINTVRRHANNGTLKAIMLGKKYLVAEDDLNEFITIGDKRG